MGARVRQNPEMAGLRQARGAAVQALARNLQRAGHALTVRDLDRGRAAALLEHGASWAETPQELAQGAEVVITSLPSPAAVATVMEAEDGVLAGLGRGAVWIEMSTTDAAEVRRLGLVEPGGEAAGRRLRPAPARARLPG